MQAGGISGFYNGVERILPKEFDVVGLSIYGGIIAVCILYLVCTELLKWYKRRKHGDPILSGATRWAAAAGDLEALDALSLAPKFDIESDLDGFTALHAAVIGGHRDTVLWLCQRGADVNAIKDDGWDDTALHYVAARGDLETARVLLAYGADPSPSNAHASTPAELARKRKHKNLADYLDAIELGKAQRPLPQDLEGWKPLDRAASGAAIDTPDLENGPKSAKSKTKKTLTKEEDAAWRAAMARSYDGLGTEGTKMKPYTKLFRVSAVLMQTASLAYLAWRGLRSLVPSPAGLYAYSLIFYIFELSFMPLSFIFVASLWNTITRPMRWAGDMLPKEKLPHVDVYVVRYTEDVDILEPTVIAALNMNWPGDKLTVHILDDGAGKDVLKMVRRLRYQLTCMKREARLVYVARRRVHGVPHHAKAGNINHAILRSQGQGEFIMVLDTDMIAHPDFLQRTIGHFYKRRSDGSSGWEQKKRTAFIQTPQDFWNVPPSDPMVHCARFFYGPMLQGRDGIGATPCCGTGVVFSRTSLVSIGGQSYGSITEDYNTSMTLFASGFSSMFLNERLVYGMAPEGLIDVFKQRRRWATGALQILFKDDPLKKAGLTFLQSILFFEAAAYHFLAVPTLFMCLAPFTFIFGSVAPVTVYAIWEFAVAFGSYFLLNRLTMWIAARGIKGADIELWRGWQMWIWMAPNHLRAIWTVIKSETWLCKLTCSKAIAFKVTSKEGSRKFDAPAPPKQKDIQALWATLRVTWYFVLYDLLFIASIIYIIYGGVAHLITPWILVVNFTSLFWVVLNCWCIWPPVSTLLPRVETEKGWRIQWKAFFLPANMLETALSGFGITTMKLLRLETLPPPSSGPPQPMLDFGRFSNSRGNAAAAAAAAVGKGKGSDVSDDSITTTQDFTTYKSGKLSKYKSEPLVIAVQSGGQVSPSGRLSATTTRASSGNFGRVAAPLHTAASLQSSAFLTATILPEREGHSTVAARQPSLVAIAPSGAIYPAPAGSMPYDVLPSASSLARGRSLPRRDTLQGITIDQQIQMAADQVMSTTSAPPAASSLAPALSLQRMPSAKPFWMEPTIEEDASYHPSGRVSYSGPYGQAAREAAEEEAATETADVITAAAAKLLTVAEAEEEPGRAISGEANPFSGYKPFTNDSETATGANTSRRGSALLLAGSIGATELAALATLTGDFDALRYIAPVSSSPFILSDIRTHQLSSPEGHSSDGTSPCPPASEVTSPARRGARVSFQGVSPFDDNQAPTSPIPFTAPKQQLPANTNAYLLEQSIRIDEFEESAFLTKSLILNEQAAFEDDFLSPFAAVAEEEWGHGKLHSGTSSEPTTPIHHRLSTGRGVLETAPSAAQQRKQAASRQLLDIAATLSPMASAALRTGSVLVVPVMPSSIYDHSIVSKPCFEASPPAPRDFTYLVVSFVLVFGLIACSLAEVPLRDIGY